MANQVQAVGSTLDCLSSMAMAGLGLFNQKSVRALAPRGLLKSAYDFLCLIYNIIHKKPQGTAKSPRAVFTYAWSYTQKTCFGPPGGLW